MTMFWPAMVRLPVRVSPRFSLTVKLTVPEPVWLLLPDTVTNDWLLFCTVHEQPLPVLTDKVALAPAPDRLKVVVEMVKGQFAWAGGVGLVGVSESEHAVNVINSSKRAEASLINVFSMMGAQQASCPSFSGRALPSLSRSGGHRQTQRSSFTESVPTTSLRVLRISGLAYFESAATLFAAMAPI